MSMESDLDSVKEFFKYLEVSRLSSLNQLLEFEILPKIIAVDESIFSIDFFTRLITTTLFKYSNFSKPLQRVPLRILRECLIVATQDTTSIQASKQLKLIAGCITKAIQQALILPCTQTKEIGPFAVPSSSLVYGLAWIDHLLVFWDPTSLPMKLFSMHCILIGLILHHPFPPKKIHAFTKFTLTSSPLKKELSSLFQEWIIQEKLKSDLFELHGGLVSLSYFANQGWIQPETLHLTSLLTKHLLTCKYPVPKPVLRLSTFLLSKMDVSELILTSEKILLRSPEVVLPSLYQYFTSRDTAQDVSLTEAFIKNLTQQFSFSNSDIAQCVSQTFLLLFPKLNEHVQIQLAQSALSVLSKCTTIPQKSLIYKTLEQVTLPMTIYTLLLKNLKTESNDTLALLILQVLWSATAAANTALKTSVLMEGWSRVNEKIRKQVLESAYTSGRLIPFDKLKGCQDPVALALLLKSNAFDPVSEKAKLIQLVATKSVDAYYVHAFNLVCQWGSDPPLLTPMQFETCFKAIFHSNMVHLLDPSSTRKLTATSISALHSFASQLPAFPTFVQRKHFKAILNHLNSSDTLLSFLLLAHHPVLPEGLWSDFAFLSKVLLESWMVENRSECIKVIQEACISDIPWEREAALRAATSLTWIYDQCIVDFVNIANDLVEKGKALQRELSLEEASSSPSAKNGKSTSNHSSNSSTFGKNSARPTSGKKLGTKKKESLTSSTAATNTSSASNLFRCTLPPEAYIAQGLALIRSILIPNKNFEPVVHLILSILTTTEHSDIQETWYRLQVLLDECMHKNGPLLFALLGPANSCSMKHEDEMVSSLLFQILCLCRSDYELSPLSFVLLHVLLRKVYHSALARMSSGEKVVMNRILDHITFMVEIISHHSPLAFSNLIPIQELLEELFTMMKIWTKHASLMHEAIVALCHARKEFSIEESNILKAECLSGNELAMTAALEASLYLTSPFPKAFQIVVLSLTYHPVFSPMANSLVERHRFSASLEDLNIFLSLCIHTPLATSSCHYLENLFQTSDLKELEKILLEFYSVIGKEYQAYLHVPKKFDEFGLEIVEDIDTVTPRLGILECLTTVVPYLPSNSKVLKTWVPCLDDPCADIQAGLLRALQMYVSKHNRDKEFLPILKSFSTHKNDDVRMSVSVLMGAFACHLAPDDPLSVEIVQALLEALRTPSEKVQTVVAKSLALFPHKVQDSLLKKLSQTLLKEKHYGAQRGCAYAIAETFEAHKSLMSSFKVVDVLKKNLNSKQTAARQGALLLVECCTLVLGRKFEPYLVVSAPYFLELCADTNSMIRQATLDATRVMMACLSSHAAILLMPVLLEGLKSEAWRTKKASVEMIAVMTKGAPTQLGSALPMLIQAILEASTDSHLQVSNAATEALKSLSLMIQVPELMDLAPMLVDALFDPRLTMRLLQLFMATTLEHYLDAPCLALLVPNLGIGLSSRQPEVKLLAAQILLSLTKVVKRQQLLAYVNTLVDLLRRALSDAVDKNRSVASKALGQLVRTLGCSFFPSIVHDLFHVLNQSTGNFDKTGASEALSEVLAALGVDELKKWMNTILKGLKGEKRDGYLVLLVYLPTTFRNAFAPFLGVTLPCVLAGLADELPMIRDTAKRAANVVIERFSTSAVDLLLTELLKCLFNPNSSVRQSSVELLGDLLGQLMGKPKSMLEPQASNTEFMFVEGTGNDQTTTSEDQKDNASKEDTLATLTTTQKLKSLTDAIGHDMYRQTLASIYLLRYDPAIGVRHASMAIWRKIVYNTPRQLKEIFPDLLQLVLQCLNKENVLPLTSTTRNAGNVASEMMPDNVDLRTEESSLDAGEDGLDHGISSDEDEEELEDEAVEASESFTMASSTLDDVVRKLGDSIFVTLLPLLASQLSTFPKGVCLSISVLIQLCPKAVPEETMVCFSNCIHFALQDTNKIVREAGSLAFLELLSHCGPMCISIVLEPMLSQIPASLPGLEMVVTRKGHVILPVLLPSFLGALNDPVTLQVLQRLFTISSMKGSTVQVLRILLSQYNESIVPIIRCLLSHPLSDNILDQILELLEEFRIDHLGAVCTCISALLGQASTHIKQIWLEWLISVLDSINSSDVEALFEGVDALVKSINKEDLDVFVGIVTTGLSKYKSNPLALETHPRGPAPLLQIVLHSLMYGGLKEQALRGLLQIIDLTPSSNLKAHIVPITGPLIRILGDRVNNIVKALVLESVASLLLKVGFLLKPFLPQLSRSLLKQLEVEDPQILQVTQNCLVELIPLHPRPDMLLQELSTFFKSPSTLDSVSISVEQVVVGVLMAHMACVQDPASLENVILTSLTYESNLAAQLIAKYFSRFPKEAWILLKSSNRTFLARIYFFYLETQISLTESSDSISDAIPKLKEIVQFVVQGLNDGPNELFCAFSALAGQFLFFKNLKVYQAMCSALESPSYILKRCLLHSFASQAQQLKLNDVTQLVEALIKLLKTKTPLKTFADQCLHRALKLNFDDKFYRAFCDAKLIASEDMAFLAEYYNRTLKKAILPRLPTNDEIILSISVSSQPS